MSLRLIACRYIAGYLIEERPFPLVSIGCNGSALGEELGCNRRMALFLERYRLLPIRLVGARLARLLRFRLLGFDRLGDGCSVFFEACIGRRFPARR